MDNPQNTIIKAFLTLLSTIYINLKDLLTKGFAKVFKQEPELELNKPADTNTGAGGSAPGNC